MRFRVADDEETVLDFAPRLLVIAGFTGRDRAAVQRHIEELAHQGIQPPPSVPAFYPLPPDLLTAGPSIQVSSAESSGEVEPVLLCAPDGWYVAVGSDHTARDVERLSIEESKRCCPKPVSAEAWPYARIEGRADRIVLRSWVEVGGRRELYQEATLAELMPAADVVRACEERIGQRLEEGVVFLGTVPLRTGRFVFGDAYEMEMEDLDGGRRLTCAYRVGVVRE